MRPYAAALATVMTLASVSASAVEALEPIYVLSAAAYRLPPGTPIAVVELAGGSTVEIVLLEDEAPLTAAHFVNLAERQTYNGTVWNRVVPGFVVQGGALSAVGRFDETPAPEREINDEVCTRGAVFLARTVIPEGADGYRYAETLGDQFCVLLNDALYLNDDFTVFGRVISGVELLDDVEEMEPITSVRVVRVP
ncbi:MAG: peptidylprolyl isomerase [Candidatus Coatesbacteria bacterium]|nr:MAG: peptidylprolyl isomerase [Candidatus Coatesbacteria bacterium]